MSATTAYVNTPLEASNSTDHTALENAFNNVRLMKFYSLIIIIIVGITSNMLALVVLSKSHIKKTSTGIYLILLAVADTVVLLAEFLKWLHERDGDGSILGIDLMHISGTACVVFNYFRYFGRIWSCWMVVIITVERYLSIAHPLRVTNSNTKRALVICVIEVILAALISSPVFFTLGIKLNVVSNRSTCYITNQTLYKFVLYLGIFAGELFLPSVIVLVFTLLILHKLYKASELRRIISISEPNSRSSQLTSTLLGLALIFLFIRLPYIITYILDRYCIEYKQSWTYLPFRAALDFSYVLSVTNYATNFFLYCMCGSMFRNELRRVFCSRWASRRHSPTYILDPQSVPSARQGRLSRVRYDGLGTVVAAL